METFFGAVILSAAFCMSMIAQSSVAGEWMITLHDPFAPDVSRLVLVVNGDALSGSH